MITIFPQALATLQIIAALHITPRVSVDGSPIIVLIMSPYGKASMEFEVCGIYGVQSLVVLPDINLRVILRTTKYK